jgi:hypothetical protein
VLLGRLDDELRPAPAHPAQTRFAVDTPATDVVAGMVFPHALHELRPRALVEQCEALERRFVYPGVSGSLFASPPCLSLPLLAAADRVHVTAPGAPPPPLTADVAEDCSVLGAPWAPGGAACGSNQRIRHAAAAAAAAAAGEGQAGGPGAVFPAGATVTAWFYSQDGALCLDDFAFALPVLPTVRWRLAPVLRDMPLQFALWRRDDGQPLLVVQLWHQELLQPQAARASSTGRMATPAPMPVGA